MSLRWSTDPLDFFLPPGLVCREESGERPVHQDRGEERGFQCFYWGENRADPEKVLLDEMFKNMGNPSMRVVLWDGQVVVNNPGGRVVQMLIRDPEALLQLVNDCERYFGDLYVEGRIEILGDFLQFMQESRLFCVKNVSGFLQKKTAKAWQEIRVRTLVGVDDHFGEEEGNSIQSHHEPGEKRRDDFFKLWLDEQRVQTCAYFATPDASLEEAQKTKMDIICHKLNLQPNDQIIEAGGDWGALALHMAKNYGVTVSSFGSSGEQLAFARKKAKELGLGRRVEFIEDDFRNAHGEYDAFVSVGMLERVGVDHYYELGSWIDLLLKENGRGLIQSIGVNYSRPVGSWIEQSIFCGASLPSLGQMISIFEPFNFAVLGVENLRPHYTKTIQHWLERYERHNQEIMEMLGPRSARAWKLHLAGSLTAFQTGGLQLFQVLFARQDYSESRMCVPRNCPPRSVSWGSERIEGRDGQPLHGAISPLENSREAL